MSHSQWIAYKKKHPQIETIFHQLNAFIKPYNTELLYLYKIMKLYANFFPISLLEKLRNLFLNCTCTNLQIILSHSQLVAKNRHENYISFKCSNKF